MELLPSCFTAGSEQPGSFQSGARSPADLYLPPDAVGAQAPAPHRAALGEKNDVWD